MKAYPLFCLATLLAVTIAPPGRGGAVIREPGAIYLEDLVDRPVKLQTLAATPIYYLSDMGRYLGTIPKGQIVELQAIADEAYRVRGPARQGQVAGWVDPKNLTKLKKEFLDSLQKNAARKAEVDDLVARNEVAINMTPEEVLQSLGKPSKKTARLDAGGRVDVWEFVRYQRVPQQVTAYDRFGRLTTSFIYVKVPAGKLAVTFENELVSALEQSEGTLEKDARVKIVAAPLAVFF
ncbi:MAG: hypothetical protein M3463_04530 [Verrucomicrobiota bacterium]|nr:hypothetical protein [Verrucomicrobiota bacterium]